MQVNVGLDLHVQVSACTLTHTHTLYVAWSTTGIVVYQYRGTSYYVSVE